MIRNFLLIGWRYLVKDRWYTLVNLAGLTLGITCLLFAGMYIMQERSVNRKLKDSDRQYILQSKWTDPNMGESITTLAPLARALRDNYPQLVSGYYRFDAITSNVSRGDKVFREVLQVGDSSLLLNYGFELLHGNPQSAFLEPFSVVITEDRAIKYFGRIDVIGQTLDIESFSGGRHPFRITGVMKTAPDNSVVRLTAANDNRIYLSLSSLPFFGRDMSPWANQYIVGLVTLEPGVKPEDVQRAMQQLVKEHAPPSIAKTLLPQLVRLDNFYFELGNGLVRRMVFTVGMIALFIFVMALINFINVAISKSAGRNREIGVRKLLGGFRKQLIWQFLIEAMLLVFVATLLSIGLLYLLRDGASALLDRQLDAPHQHPLLLLTLPILITLTVGTLAGIYPAFILSGQEITEALKGWKARVKENVFFRRALAGFQFFMAFIVLAGAVIVSKQVSLFFSDRLGYDKSYVISAQVPRNWTAEGVQKLANIRSQFAAMPDVQAATVSYEIPNGNNVSSLSLYGNGRDSSSAVSAQMLVTDEHYLETYKIPMKAGQYYRSLADTNRIVINETAAKALGFTRPAAAVGQPVQMIGGASAEILGVVADFHIGSMQQAIPPAGFIHVASFKAFRYLSFKLPAGPVQPRVEALQKKWSQVFPGAAFEYQFMDQTLARVYANELRMKKAAEVATIVAFIIVLLGLAGLVSLSVRKRVREIGIRRVLGASPRAIIQLFLKEFVPVLAMGGLIGIPVSWWLMKGWLNDYATRIDPSPMTFVVCMLVLLAGSVFMMAAQLARTALTSPSTSLKTE